MSLFKTNYTIFVLPQDMICEVGHEIMRVVVFIVKQQTLEVKI